MSEPEIFMHFLEKPDACQHQWDGFRDLFDDDGRPCGDERVCSKCGMGAMHYSLMRDET